MAVIKGINEKRQILKKLVDTFRKNYEQYQETEYKEQRIRTDYLNKFFELFDWDISNEEGAIEEFRDVVIEDNLEISGAQKSPDFSFRIGSDIVFYVEAKKPSVNIKEAIPPAFQLRRYGHSADLKISILTDFHEFAIYDTTVRPGKNDKPSVARLFYCTYDEYEKNFDFLYGLFAKENVRKGSIKDYITGSGIKKGTSQLDKEFLKLIETWRSELAKNIARNNKRADIDGINMAVQKIIDRIIFLRIAEEKGIELYENLLNISKREKNLFKLLTEYFDKANRKYNSELFRYEAFINDLYIDDDVLIDIINGLYYPECPYAFSVLPVEILGNIYEQFLGKTIRLTEGHQAKIEEKPEVRKAGGVYYTPKYIVDYIVKNTVGEKIKGATPKEIEKLKILDPACGSGSFLLGAYSYLLIHHLTYYTKKDNISKAIKNGNIFQAHTNSYRLTIQEKQKILLNNIFGVDIDAQAVEVTKLSLLLKLMEGESDESAGQLFKHSDIKLLPNLSDNIKCGNSLIGSDFYKGKNLSLFDDESMKKINAFDWDSKERGFGEIMARGGFDLVIGNPPYGALFGDEEKAFLENQFASFEYQMNSFSFFIEKATILLKKSGLVSYIVPAVFLAQHYFLNLRKFILMNCEIHTLLSLNFKVFQDAETGDTSIFVFSKKQAAQKNNVIKCAIIENEEGIGSVNYDEKEQSEFLRNPRLEFFISANMDIIKKIQSISVPLGGIANCVMGIKPYQKGKGKPKQNAEIVNSRIFDSTTPKNQLYKRYLIGKDIDRYIIKPKAKRYIKYGDWLAEPRPGAPFEREKIMVRQTSDVVRGVIDTAKYYNLNNIYNIELLNKDYDYRYLLGILNSTLMVFVYQAIVPEKGRLFAEIKKTNLDKLPIRKINTSNPKSKKMTDQLISLVAQMLDAQKVQNQQKIDLLDKQIDELVYELYGLTKEEIELVENA